MVKILLCQKPSYFSVKEMTVQYKILNSSYQFNTISFLHTEMKDIEPHCAVILWFYSPILQIISFYLPTLPQSDFLKDIRNNFTSCNIIIQKKGCKLTKKKKLVVSTRKKSKTKHIAWKLYTRPKYIIFIFVFIF